MDYCFYLDWKGMTPSEWAAWTQAILSGAAIFAAAMIPAWQEKRTRKRRIDVYVDIISHADSEAKSTLRHIELSVGQGVRSTEEREWTTLCKVFDGIPFHDVPDYQLYGVIRDAARSSAAIREVYEPLLTSEDKVTEAIVWEVREQARVLAQCYEDAADISNRLAGKSLRYRWFKLISTIRTAVRT